MSDAVTVEYGDGVIEITINRPEARNAINGAVRAGITEALAELDGRDDLAIAILTGAGGTFCAGMDLKAFLAGELSGEPGRGMAGLAPVQPRKPVIAAIEGYALAGGCELALTGDFFSAADAQRYGLVNSLTAAGEAMAGARALAARITANGPLAVAATKEIVTRAADWTFEEGWDGQQPILGPVFASQDGPRPSCRRRRFPLEDGYRLEQDYTARVSRFDDALEARGARLEKRDPTWNWR